MSKMLNLRRSVGRAQRPQSYPTRERESVALGGLFCTDRGNRLRPFGEGALVGEAFSFNAQGV